MEKTNNKTIAKNTMFLYFRMMLTMVISLYTSRVILKTLGIDDYGLYQVVGGVVGFLSFLNGALSTGSSRFLTFELGKGNKEKLNRTFSTTLNIHICMAFIILILAETIGLWFVYNKLVIPPDRLNAAVFVYHISILTALVSITQIPYNASIISHEKMGIYAYTSIVEVSLKLAIVYLLVIGDFDKLKLYASLLCIVQIGMALFYRFYCTNKFKECHFSWKIDHHIFKEIAGFSGWSMFASISIALNNQGTTIITNMFFGPAIVTARALSLQVNMAAMQFVNNFRTAANPQIVKRYASNDIDGSKRLLLNSTLFSYYLMLLLGLPIILLAEPLLNLWLDQVPPYSVIFLQLIIIQSLFSVFDTSFYTALYAKGRLRENAIISPLMGFIQFPVVYLLFKAGCSPVSLSWAGIVTYMILGIVIKPILVSKIVEGYKLSDFYRIICRCTIVTIVASIIPLYVSYNYPGDGFIRFIVICLVSFISIITVVYFIGIDKQMKKGLYIMINEKLRKK